MTDLLQNIEALVRLGYGRDSRIENALDLIRKKQDTDGRWLLEYDYSGKTWFDFIRNVFHLSSQNIDAHTGMFLQLHQK